MSNTFSYYAITVSGMDIYLNLPFLAPKNDDLFVSSSTKISTRKNMAHIDSLDLAKEFIQELAKVFNSRYGEDIQFDIIKLEGTHHNTAKKIKKDSEIIRKRIKAGNFASNKMPE